MKVIYLASTDIQPLVDIYSQLLDQEQRDALLNLKNDLLKEKYRPSLNRTMKTILQHTAIISTYLSKNYTGSLSNFQTLIAYITYSGQAFIEGNNGSEISLMDGHAFESNPDLIFKMLYVSVLLTICTLKHIIQVMSTKYTLKAMIDFQIAYFRHLITGKKLNNENLKFLKYFQNLIFQPNR